VDAKVPWLGEVIILIANNSILGRKKIILIANT